MCVSDFKVHLLEEEFEAKSVKQENSSGRKRLDLEFWTRDQLSIGHMGQTWTQVF